MQTETDTNTDYSALIEELARKFVGRQAAQNVLHTEVRYSSNVTFFGTACRKV